MLQALKDISIPELQNRFKTQLWTFWFSPPLSDIFIIGCSKRETNRDIVYNFLLCINGSASKNLSLKAEGAIYAVHG